MTTLPLAHGLVLLPLPFCTCSKAQGLCTYCFLCLEALPRHCCHPSSGQTPLRLSSIVSCSRWPHSISSLPESLMRKENPSVFRAIMLLQFYSPVPVTQLKPQEGAGPGLLWHLGSSDRELCRAGLPLLSEPGESRAWQGCSGGSRKCV